MDKGFNEEHSDIGLKIIRFNRFKRGFCLLKGFSTLDAFHAYWRLNCAAFLAFHGQLCPAFLTVVSEEGGLTASGAVDYEGKPAGVASNPVGLD